jgi:transglutaminase-like putative cysteine protease
MSNRQPPAIVDDAMATAALCAYTLAVSMGFARVFSGWAFFGDLATIAIVGHGVSFALRRARVSGWIAVPGLCLVLGWLMAVLHYRDTMGGPVPWTATWDRVRFDLGLVRDEFPTAIAPVLYDVVGWAALASIAIALVVVLSDSFAFRAEARGESLVPGGVLFVFVAALGDDRLRVASTVLLIATGVVAVIALRRLHDRDRGAVLRSRRPATLAIPIALATALGIAVVAGVVGPRLPGAHAEALYDTKGRGGTNFVDNPIVDIRSRLVNQGNVELFQVNADQPHYWRSATLAEFDGRLFRRPDARLADVDESGEVDLEDRTQIRQQIQIRAAGGKFVPAAADARFANGEQVDGEPIPVQHPLGSNDLIVQEDLQPGDLFIVESYAIDVSREELRAAGSKDPPDPIYLELPDGLPDVVYDETERLTAGLPTTYDQARALQSWFQDGEFEYSTEIQAGHGSDSIESFLRVRAGYCEQFAGTFAVMARIAEIPSRVAVGYTQGVQNADGWYSVIGKNAHAWPELWFDGIGWVAFEPTPGRGAPGAEEYTGIPASQDDSGPSSVGANPNDDDLRPDLTTPPTVVASGGPPTTPPLSPGGDERGSELIPRGAFDGVSGGGGDQSPPTGSSFAWTLLVIALLLIAGFAAPWLIRRVTRARRRGQDPREQVAAAWARARTAAREAGVAGTSAMTASEWTAATATLLPVAARPMRSLADVVDRVTFAPTEEVDLAKRGSFGDRLSDDCELWSNQVTRIATDTLSTTKRIQRYFTHYD